MIQVGIPLRYGHQRYFVNDLSGALRLLWDRLHERAGDQKLNKPKARIVYTANLYGYEHRYDSYLIMEAELWQASEE